MQAINIILLLCFVSVYVVHGVAAKGFPECGQDPTAEYLTSNPHSSEQRVYSSPKLSEQWLVYTECRAERGDPKAQLSMGIVYRDGADGPPQNYKMAKGWFLKSAQNGNGMAMYNLGLMFFGGIGVDPDHVQAYSWFSLAASFLPEDGIGTRNQAFEYRDRVAKRLPPSQLVEAQELSTERYRQISQALH